MQIEILGVNIDCLTKTEVLDKISGFLESNQQHHLVTTNPEFILAAQKDEEFRNIINKSSLSVADGMGIRMAAKYLDMRSKNRLIAFWQGLRVGWWGIFRRAKLDVVPEVVTGTDLVREILDFRSQILDCRFRERVFLLGGRDGVAKLTAGELKKDFDEFEFDYGVPEEKEIVNKINRFKPHILFVALNHPRAQKWINQNLDKMPSVRVAIGVGGAFDYISGRVRRAPGFLRKVGLEWLYRLIKQPKRWKRVWDAFPNFPIEIYLSK